MRQYHQKESVPCRVDKWKPFITKNIFYNISEVLNPVIFKLYEIENVFFCKGLKEIRLKG